MNSVGFQTAYHPAFKALFVTGLQVSAALCDNRAVGARSIGLIDMVCLLRMNGH